MNNPLSQPLRLPGGAILANRLAKAAMSEGMADANAGASPARGSPMPSRPHEYAMALCRCPYHSLLWMTTTRGES